MSTLHRVLLGLFAAALCFAVAVPHVHAGADRSHQQSACRACNLQDGFSATPQAAPVRALPSVPVAAVALPGRDTARALVVTRHVFSRAPPLLS